MFSARMQPEIDNAYRLKRGKPEVRKQQRRIAWNSSYYVDLSSEAKRQCSTFYNWQIRREWKGIQIIWREQRGFLCFQV